MMQATGDVVVLFAAWAVTMFSSGVPAFNVELEGDSFHLQLSRAQLVHRVCQVPSSVHSAESSPPGNASLTWRPVKASRMDGALQHGPDGRRSSTIWSWAVEVRLLHGPAFGPVSRRSSTTSGAISLTNQRPPERPRQRRGWVPWWGCGSRPYGPSGCASAVTIVSAGRFRRLGCRPTALIGLSLARPRRRETRALSNFLYSDRGRFQCMCQCVLCKHAVLWLCFGQ